MRGGGEGIRTSVTTIHVPVQLLRRACPVLCVSCCDQLWRAMRRSCHANFGRLPHRAGRRLLSAFGPLKLSWRRVPVAWMMCSGKCWPLTCSACASGWASRLAAVGATCRRQLQAGRLRTCGSSQLFTTWMHVSSGDRWTDMPLHAAGRKLVYHSFICCLPRSPSRANLLIKPSRFCGLYHAIHSGS